MCWDSWKCEIGERLLLRQQPVLFSYCWSWTQVSGKILLGFWLPVLGWSVSWFQLWVCTQKKLIPNHGDRKSTSAVVHGALAMLLKCWLACHTAETPCKYHCGTQTRKCRREVLQSYHRYEWSRFICARCVHNHVQYRLKAVLF